MRMEKISVRCCVDLGFNDLFGLNAFTLSPTRWIEATNAIGLFIIVAGTVPCHAGIVALFLLLLFIRRRQ